MPPPTESSDEQPRPSEAPDGEFFRSLVENNSNAIVTIDESDSIIYANQSVETVFGYSPEELIGEQLATIVPLQVRPDLLEAVERYLETGERTLDRNGVELPAKHRDGHDIQLSVSFEAGVYDDGRVCSAVVSDISERKEADREHLEVVGRMADAFFAVDEDWRLTYVNERAKSILANAMGSDRVANDMTGLHLWEEIPEAVETPFYDHYHEAMSSQKPVSFEEFYEPLDTWFEVRAYPSDTGLSVYFHDVTERRRYQEAVEERERVLREIYEITADTDRSFTEQVDALLEKGCETLGMSYGTLSQIQGDEYTFEAVRAPNDDVQAGDTAALSATNCERAAATREQLVLGNIAEDDTTLTEKGGYTEWGIASYVGAPVLVEDEVYGTFCFYDEEPQDEEFSEWETTLVDLMSLWVGYELTRRQTHERLERQNEQLDQFASIVTHDLRNPLNILEGSLELAEESGDAAHFDQCRWAVERMRSLIDDVLTLARTGQEIEATEPVALSPLVESCWQTVATEGATLDVTAERTVLADASRLRQLFENLVRNAVEHGGDGIRIVVGDTDDGFYVADDGPGIPAGERGKVFEAGYSTADDGTGFGLNIVEQIAAAHGWDVTVGESERGGAQFAFSGVETVTGR